MIQLTILGHLYIVLQVRYKKTKGNMMLYEHNRLGISVEGSDFPFETESLERPGGEQKGLGRLI